jgi:hypothetical protein
MTEKRGSLYLITGLLVGIVLGVLLSWGFSPGEHGNTSPASMRADFKDAYRVAIAASYAATGDITRAEARLSLLEDEDPQGVLAAQSQRYLAEGFSYNDARALAMLAAALGEVPAPAQQSQMGASPTVLPPSLTPPATDTPTLVTEQTATETVDPSIETNTPEVTSTSLPSDTPLPSLTFTNTPILTFTPLPSRTPTPTVSPPFVFDNQALVCDPLIKEPVLQILVTDAAGDGVAGVEIVIQWDENEERFYTGLKPEMGWGYADYRMIPETTYIMHVAEGGKPLEISAPECSGSQGTRYWGSWRLSFTHP